MLSDFLILALLLAGHAALASETLTRRDGARDRKHQEVKERELDPRHRDRYPG
jgi:hypothetical protein